MYGAFDDPYCYPGTNILQNRLNIRDQETLDRTESLLARQRAKEKLPAGRLSETHYRAIHKHLFQDVYSWAGAYRTVRISKGSDTFCYPEHIGREMRAVFGTLQRRHGLKGLAREDFAREYAAFLATLNAIHPFREGNGRTQLAFTALLATRAGHPLDLSRLQPKMFLNAMVASFKGDEAPLVRQIARLIA
jgi:cell filamentation protein